MTDLENRFWLCEQVLEVRQQGGMSLERALAMLHKLTDLETHEPYLSDQPPVPGVMWDHGEPLVEAQVQDLREAWAEDRYDDGLEPLLDGEDDSRANTWIKLAGLNDEFTDENGVLYAERIGDYIKGLTRLALADDESFEPPTEPLLPYREPAEPDAERHCPICWKVLERKRSESHASFAARETDSRSCAATLREQRRREEVAA